MAVPLRMNKNKGGVLTRFRSLISPQSFHSPRTKGGVNDQLSPETGSEYSAFLGRINNSKWKSLDARSLGITDSMISDASRTVLNLLWRKGFECYLVGGCVRDLILNRTPKDFDVITTAKLNQVKKRFCRAEIVGRRFPVCLVHIKRSIVEVTSFETVAQTAEGKEHFLYSLVPKSCNKKDLILYKNTLHRDFTMNSLFYDPFANKIYDYTNGMADLRSLKLQTVLPAQLSFKEDPGRILRGFRIAARLGLSLSRETEAAIWTFSSLVKNLDKNKIMIELNYMLSYGSAEASLRLLWKFNLLEFLLPVHAAYLDQQVTKEDDAQASNMLMKLFSHLDNLVACDRPSDCTLWVGLLAFHLALANNPQDAIVVWALAAVLYHGDWEGGVKFAKEHAVMCVNFAPEIMSSIHETDEDIAKAVTQLASLVVNSIPALVENNSLLQSMSRYHPSLPCSGMVFVPRKTGKLVSEIFQVLVDDVESYTSKRNGLKINYDMLGRGNLPEIRFVLGKVVLETMRSGIVGDEEDFEAEKCHLKAEGTKEIGQLLLSDLEGHQSVARKNKRKVSSTPNREHEQEKIKKWKSVENGCIPEQKMGLENDEFSEKFEYKETVKEHQKSSKICQKVDLSMKKDSLPKSKNSHRKQLENSRGKIAIACKRSLDNAGHLKMVENNTWMSSRSSVFKDNQVIADNCNINVDAKTTKESDLKKKELQLSPDKVSKEKQRQQQHKSK